MESLERFARIRAAIEQEGDRDRVLREAGLAPAEWIQLQRRCLDALAAEIASGRDTLAKRYCEAFEAARSPAPVSNEPGVEAEAPKPESVAVHVPSYLKAPVPVAPVAAAPRPNLGGTALALDIPRMPAMPFKEGAPAPSIASAPEPKPASRIQTGTAIALELPRAPATPFRAEPDATQSATTSLDTSAPASKPGATTAFASPAPAGPSTPFEALSPEAMGFNVMRYAELVAARDEAGSNLTAVLAEFEIDAGAHDRIEAYWRRKFSENGLLALDFGRIIAQAKRARSERRAASPAAPAGAVAAAAPAASKPGTGTAIALDVPRITLPFAAAANEPAAPASTPAPAAPVPELTVEQYAWITASLRKTTDVPSTLARFRLTAESRKDLEAKWAQRMAADPALRESFITALGRYLQGGGG